MALFFLFLFCFLKKLRRKKEFAFELSLSKKIGRKEKRRNSIPFLP